MILKIQVVDFWPVVQRELREGARRPFNYWLRVGGAAAGVFLLCVVQYGGDGNPASDGLRLFTGLHKMLLVLICVMVPAMSADCIAREKREGTLGLLFLTPLTAMGVVAGKVLVQAFRAFTLWLAVLPVIVIPFLSGGVTVGDVASAVTIEFCVTLLCLAAGILASTLARARSAAFVLAACLAVEFVCLFGALLGWGFLWQTVAAGQSIPLSQITRTGQSLITGQESGNRVFIGVTTIVGRGMPLPRYIVVSRAPGRVVTPSPVYARSVLPAGWSGYFSAPATRDVWRSLLLESLLAVPLLFFLVLRFAARRMALSWQDKPPSLRREGWIKTFCVPLAKRRFARRMRETLEWNPVAWLQQYSWKARLSKWGLCLGLVLIECAASTGSATDLADAQSLMVLVLAAAFTFVGVNSFLTEKKSGALELLLVTLVTPNEIIRGRVWGLWKQFLPAALTLLLLQLFADYLVNMSAPSFQSTLFQSTWLSLQYSGGRGNIWKVLGFDPGTGYSPIDDSAFHVFVVAVGFLTLPVFATYFALRVKNLIVAAALTWLALFLCLFFAISLHAFVSVFVGDLPDDLYVEVLLSNLAFALLACFLLSHSLSRRIYSF
jgi:ABC-type transport system involved in multi-copper enzyme maturation permease subunit